MQVTNDQLYTEQNFGNQQGYQQGHQQGYPQQVYPPQQQQQGYPQQQQYYPEYHNSYYHGNYASYGDMYYTPVMMKNNEPVKQDSSMHVPIIVTSILFWAGIIVGAIGANSFLTDVLVGVIIGISYVIYLCTACVGSDVRGYITNLKAFDDYKNIYDLMINGKGFFSFYICCYHYQTRTDHEGRTHQQRVVTHTANERYNPTLSEDDSGNISGIKDITKYVFIDYMKRFYFADEKSAKKYENDYQNFIQNNTRDVHQDYSSTFGIDGFQDNVGFCALGDGGHNSCMFYILTFIGLALPYVCILERSVSRYSIDIVKRLTCS